MISALIFATHLLFATYIFTKKWQSESLSSAFINFGLIVILFSVGWSITGMIAKVVIGPKGFGIYFDRDTLSLTLLTIAEFFFYKIYYGKEESIEAGTEIQ